MHSFDINLENISKTEGHANLAVQVRDGTVQDVKLEIIENQRFYEQAVRGQSITTAPQLMSRICGTCSIAHLLCCIEAIENGLGIKPSEQSAIMKKLTTYGLMIRDHALHLYFFSLPDLLGKDSILDFKEDNEFEHKLLHDSFDIKRAGNMLSTLIAGKAVHAPFPTVGGFLKIPEESDIIKVTRELKKIRPQVLDIIKVFYDWQQKFERETDYVSLKTDDYSFLQGSVTSSRGICIQEKDYLEHLIKITQPYTQAPEYEFEGDEFMVGALSRMNLNREALHKNTKEDCKEFLKAFPSTNVFHNNLAQAIEILHSIDHSIDLLENTKFKKEEIQRVQITEEKVGIGVIEAPRGTLYYKLTINKEGKISNANVIVPTAQNQINIERDIAKLVQENLDKPKEKIEYEIEKLIRAYDPCMSCASHFLKVTWK
jgi:sulfhydrogenase subunit alpha